MYLAAFALLSVVGGWLAWRNNPLFSLRSSLRFAVIVGVAIAAVIAAIVAAVNLTSNSSPVVVYVTMCATILAGTIGLIWVIVSVSSPPVPKLDPGTPLATIHRAKIGRWASRFAIALAVFGLLAVVLPGDGKILIGVFAGMTAFLGIVMLAAGYIAALGLDRSLTAVEKDPWLHWHYTPEQWKAWSDEQIAGINAIPPHWVWRRDWKRLLFPVGLTVLLVYALDPGSWMWKTAYLTGLAAFMVAVVAASNRFEKTAPYRLRAMLLHAAPDAYFGAGGVFAGGVYTQWQTVSNYLIEATADERTPRSLLFRFEKIVPGANPGPVEVRQSVLVPDDAADDIVRLQASLSARCPSARVALT